MSVQSFNTFTPDGRLRGSYVYMLLCPDAETIYVKVGRSASPLARLSHLRTACPVEPQIIALVEVSTRGRAGQLELALHAAFDQWRTNGEWFRFTQQDRPQFTAAWRPVLEQYGDASRRLAWRKYSVRELVKDGKRRQGFIRFQFRQRGKAFRDFKNAT